MKLEFESIEEYIEFTEKMAKISNRGNSELIKMEIKEITDGLKTQISEMQIQINKLQDEKHTCLNKDQFRRIFNTISTKEAVERGKHEPEEHLTIRQYGQSNYENFPQIKGIKPNGQFLLGGGKTSKYTMYDVLKLKKYLPDLTLNWNDLGEMIGVSHFTSKNLCCAIEDGFFDKWFDEWSEMQSKLPKNENFVENNPEKRKALMGMG